MYNILEHKQAIAENIQKAFSDIPEDIEKAKWQIGEIRTDSRGIAHECYEYTAEGKPRLRRVKKQGGDTSDTIGVRSNGLTSKEETRITNNLESQLDKLFPNKLGRISKIKIEKKKDYIEATIDSASKSKNPNIPTFLRSIVRSKDGGENWEVFSSGLMRWSKHERKIFEDKNKGASKDDGGSKKNVVDISKISDKEFKNITKILEKKNPDDSDAFRYLESEEMSNKELDNFIACAKHFKNDTKNINERTRKWCAKWEKLGEEELNNRKNTKDKQ